MISRLTGTIIHIDLKYAILDVNGIGYKVYTTSDVLSGLGKLSKNASLDTTASPLVTLWTYLAVRENALDLYGFSNGIELSLFELLITISGIGPKTALGILNIASVEAIDNAIQTGDTTHLVKVSGVGKKMAEKIVLELKDKIGTGGLVGASGQTQERTDAVKNDMRNDADVLEALKALGYNPTEARDAMKEVVKSAAKSGKEFKDTGEKVKAVLKLLSQ